MKHYKNKKVFTEEQLERIKNERFLTVTEEYAGTTGIKGDESLQELVKKYAVPPLGGEEIFEVISKYGHSFFGICDGFKWDNLDTLTELDAWKIIAFSSIYWKAKYEKWFRDEQEKNKH